jgi:hypothetical protein
MSYLFYLGIKCLYGKNIITVYMDCRLFGVRIRILSFLLVEKAVTSYSKDVKGVDSADTVIYLLGMFRLRKCLQSDIFRNVLRVFWRK